MATLNLPEHAWPTPESPYRKRLDEHRIQVPAFRCSFRVSVHVFNSRDDRERLAAALRAIKDSTR